MSAPDETSNEFDSREFLRNPTARPGVYRMLNAESEVIYVGKAGNLKKRVSSYFRERPGSAKTAAMMKQVARVEVTITSSEAEALLLEYNQIKQLKPRFNILLFGIWFWYELDKLWFSFSKTLFGGDFYFFLLPNFHTFQSFVQSFD